jgi:predicted DCC family thiol-disulfide oxidoreductase YuxK
LESLQNSNNSREHLDLNRFPILLFDEECSLCLRFKQSVESVAGKERINTISLHNPDVYGRFSFLSKDRCQAELHLLLGDDASDLLCGGDALSYLVNLFPAIKKFSWLIDSGAGQKAVKFFYKTANLYRESLLNRCPGCKN